MKREVFIQLTDDCPNGCIYCFVKKGNNKFSKVDELINFIENSNKELILHFSGGEPLLEFSTIKEIITKTKKNPKISYSITLSGFGLNNKIEYISNQIPDIEISLDGTEKNHNLNRGIFHNNHLELVKLIESGIKNYRVNMVVHTNTVSEFFENFKFVFNLVKKLDKIFFIKSFNTVWEKEQDEKFDENLIKITEWIIDSNYDIHEVLAWLNFILIKRHKTESTAISVDSHGQVFFNLEQEEKAGELNSLDINQVYTLKAAKEINTNYDFSREIGNNIIDYLFNFITKTERIYIGSACNNNCIHCLDKKFGQERFFELDLIKLIKQKISNSKSNSFLLTGGEPLMHKQLFSAVSLLNQENKLITIETNGRLLSYSDLSKKLANKKTILKIPLISHDAKIHDSITQVKGSFNQTTNGIKNFKGFDGKVIGYIPILKQNYKGIIKILNLFKSLEVDVIQISHPIFNCDNLRTNGSKLSAQYSQLKPLIPTWIEFAEKNNLVLVLNNIPPCISNVADLTMQQNSDHKVKKPNCSNCSFHKNCSGVYPEYLHFFQEEKFPIQNNKVFPNNLNLKLELIDKLFGF